MHDGRALKWLRPTEDEIAEIAAASAVLAEGWRRASIQRADSGDSWL
jgi:hypothetical protein